MDDGTAKRVRDYLSSNRVPVRKARGLPIRGELLRLISVTIPGTFEAEQTTTQTQQVRLTDPSVQTEHLSSDSPTSREASTNAGFDQAEST